MCPTIDLNERRRNHESGRKAKTAEVPDYCDSPPCGRAGRDCCRGCHTSFILMSVVSRNLDT